MSRKPRVWPCSSPLSACAGRTHPSTFGFGAKCSGLGKKNFKNKAKKTVWNHTVFLRACTHLRRPQKQLKEQRQGQPSRVESASSHAFLYQKMITSCVTTYTTGSVAASFLLTKSHVSWSKHLSSANFVTLGMAVLIISDTLSALFFCNFSLAGGPSCTVRAASGFEHIFPFPRRKKLAYDRPHSLLLLSQRWHSSNKIRYNVTAYYSPVVKHFSRTHTT